MSTWDRFEAWDNEIMKEYGLTKEQLAEQFGSLTVHETVAVTSEPAEGSVEEWMAKAAEVLAPQAA